MTLVDVRTPDPKRYIPGATGDWEVIIGMLSPKKAEPSDTP